MVLILIIALSYPTPSRAAPSEPVVIDSLGMWTLDRLGYSDQLFSPGDQEVEILPIFYRLPDSASQGPESWYVFHLHAQIEFDLASEDGSWAWIEAGDIDTACALLEFNVQKQGIEPLSDGTLPPMLIHHDSVGGIEGEVRSTSPSNVVEVTFSDYFFSAGITPGVNAMGLAVRQGTGAKVKSARVFADSGIEWTTVSPGKAEFSLDFPEKPINVGDTFDIAYTLTNVGEERLGNVTVAPDLLNSDIEIVGEKTQQFPELAGSEVKEGKFSFTALAPGDQTFYFWVNTGAGRPSYEVHLLVGGTQPYPLVRRMAMIAIAAVSVAGAFVVLRLITNLVGLHKK